MNTDLSHVNSNSNNNNNNNNNNNENYTVLNNSNDYQEQHKASYLYSSDFKGEPLTP